MPYDGWLINWSWRHAQVESCQRQTDLINIWLSLFSREPHGDSEWAAYPLDCFLWACGHDWQAITRTTHNKTTRSSAAQLWNNDPAWWNLFSERNKKCTQSFDDVTRMADPLHAPQEGIGYQCKCSILVALWLESEPTQSRPSWEHKAPFAALRLFDIVTRLLVCVQAQPRVLSWAVWDHAEKCSYIKPRDHEKVRLKRGTPVI